MSNNQMDISVSYTGLKEASEAMINKVDVMKQALDKATTVMSNTEDSFKSESADMLREKYHSLYAKFGDFYDSITKYATFLSTTATKYEEADTSIKKNAEDLLTSEYEG
ncbi:MAG: WXG100 family type VII secretion target [Candidatus Coprovivens sp.]